MKGQTGFVFEPRRSSANRLVPCALIVALIVLAVALPSALIPGIAVADSKGSRLSETIKSIKGGVVAVGTYLPTRRPPAAFKGTGFVVVDGNHVITNAHVIDHRLDRENKERFAVFLRRERKIEQRPAVIEKQDKRYDIAILRFDGPPLPVLTLSDDDEASEGTSVAFTGFPIGSVLGLYHVTHRGMISANTPIAIPQLSARQLDVGMIQQLRRDFFVYQLDATAYPGNSGSPLYDPETGEVIGIVSSVFVKDTKERVLQDPSGITYAIPIRYALELLNE